MLNRFVPVYHENGCITLDLVDILEVQGESFENLKDACNELLRRGLKNLDCFSDQVSDYILDHNYYSHVIFFGEMFQNTIDDIVSGKIKSIDKYDNIHDLCYRLPTYINNNTSVKIRTVNGCDYSRLYFRFQSSKKEKSSDKLQISHRRVTVAAIINTIRQKDYIELNVPTVSTNNCDAFVRYAKKNKLITLKEFMNAKQCHYVSSKFQEKSFKEKCIDYFKSIK